MYKTLAIQISLIFQALANTLPVNKTYAALVKEKGELFKEINEAIQESVAILKKNNDTEATLGIEYMNQLKEQLKEINENKITASNIDSNVDTRRRNKVSLNMAEIAQFLYRPNANDTEKGNENQVRVQKDLDQWVSQQLAEKAIKARKKKKDVIKEKCPRWGHDRKKKKKKTRRQYGGPTADRDYNSSASCENDKEPSTKPPERKYPCCRKCCKKSYMGCL